MCSHLPAKSYLPVAVPVRYTSKPLSITIAVYTFNTQIFLYAMWEEIFTMEWPVLRSDTVCIIPYTKKNGFQWSQMSPVTLLHKVPPEPELHKIKCAENKYVQTFLPPPLLYISFPFIPFFPLPKSHHWIFLWGVEYTTVHQKCGMIKLRGVPEIKCSSFFATPFLYCIHWHQDSHHQVTNRFLIQVFSKIKVTSGWHK